MVKNPPANAGYARDVVLVSESCSRIYMRGKILQTQNKETTERVRGNNLLNFHCMC